MIYDKRIKIHFHDDMIYNSINYSKKKFVLYWMQQSQRVNYNHALDHAILIANRLDIPILVYFGLSPNYINGNLRNYYFMMEGLCEIKEKLMEIGAGFQLILNSPEIGIDEFLENSAAVIMDKGYLKHQKMWREAVIEKSKKIKIGHIAEIDTDLVVPVEAASQKMEYAARTIRPKITNKIDEFNRELVIEDIVKKWDFRYKSSHDISSILNSKKSVDEILYNLPIDQSINISKEYHGGYSNGMKMYEKFLREKLNDYKFNSPVKDKNSKMGMYLHYGQISSLELYRKLINYFNSNPDTDKESVDGYIEQLIVRRELAFNYVYYNKNYDNFQGMTDPWAYETMEAHKNDIREFDYSIEEMIKCKTHDPFWNDAMAEMVETGFMDNYMRMYWCKKIIEWSKTFEFAYKKAIYLNNTFFLDGRDPNSYTGVAWCFGKHDHGWKERDIFGKLRYMNDKGLIRKFGMKKK